MPFIVFEGIDGSGTTTISIKFCEYLSKKGVKVAYTSEPTSGPIGTLLRSALRKEINIPDSAYFHLFMADRIWHCEFFIKPMLAKGYTIVSDRYIYSTFVYQIEECFKTNFDGSNFVEPDLVFLLDIGAEDALQRKTGNLEYFEILEKQIQYRYRYKLLEKYGFKIGNEPILTIDAHTSIENVLKSAINAWENHLQEGKSSPKK